MKNFTAIYSTSTYKNINYDFMAENMEKAIEFCKWKFSSVNIKIICSDDSKNHESYIQLSDLKDNLEIKEVKINEENKLINMVYISQNNKSYWYNADDFFKLFGYQLTELVN